MHSCCSGPTRAPAPAACPCRAAAWLHPNPRCWAKLDVVQLQATGPSHHAASASHSCCWWLSRAGRIAGLAWAVGGRCAGLGCRCSATLTIGGCELLAHTADPSGRRMHPRCCAAVTLLSRLQLCSGKEPAGRGGRRPGGRRQQRLRHPLPDGCQVLCCVLIARLYLCANQQTA